MASMFFYEDKATVLVLKIFTGECITSVDHCVKNVQKWSFSGPYFYVFALNTEI